MSTISALSTNPVSATGGTPALPGATDAVLQAELSRCEVAYADWAHCPTASKTPEGKAKADALAAQIRSIRSQLAAATQASKAAAIGRAGAPQVSNAATASASASSVTTSAGRSLHVDTHA